MQQTNQLTAAQIRSHFSYDPLQGCLYRRLGQPRYRLHPAGCKRERGYIKISFEDKSYLAHRLIWLWFHGEMTDECIDHINGDTGDNHIWNLRCVSLSSNQHNQHRNRNDRTPNIKGRSKQKLPEQNECATSST